MYSSLVTIDRRRQPNLYWGSVSVPEHRLRLTLGRLGKWLSTVKDCDVYAASSYAVAVSHGHRMTQKVNLKARVDTETGEVTF